MKKGPLIYKTTEFVLVDSLRGCTTLTKERFAAQFPNSSSYPICYIGPVKDTIRLESAGVYPFNDKPGYEEPRYYAAARNISAKLSIFVDTNITLYWRLYRDKAIDTTARCWAVIIKNVSDSIVNVGQRSVLWNAKREFLNAENKWQQYETDWQFACGGGERQHLLYPGQVAIAKLIRYCGKTQVECRLKITPQWGRGVVYSNSFIESITVPDEQRKKSQ